MNFHIHVLIYEQIKESVMYGRSPSKTTLYYYTLKHLNFLLIIGIRIRLSAYVVEGLEGRLA